MQQQMGASDLYPPTAAAVRACAAKLGSRRQFYGTDDVVADIDALRRALGVDKIALDGISYGTYVGERYALAHPGHVSKLVLDSVVPHVGLCDLGVVEFRGTARVLRSVCGQRCVDDLAAVVRRYHDGVDVLDALTTDSIVDPTYRRCFDVPRRYARRATAPRGCSTSFVASMHAGDPAPADALDQGLHASTLCADWRYPWGNSSAPLAGPSGRAEARGREAAGVRALPLRPRDRDRQRVHSPVPAVAADAADAARPREDHRPDLARERRPRSLDSARVGEAGAGADDARQARRRAWGRPLDPVALGQRRLPQRRRGVPARVGSEVIPEAPLDDGGHGLVPRGEGWFVLNTREARWWHARNRGAMCFYEGDVGFPQLGINVSVLEPGQVMSLYHWEADQEDFLVVSGEALLLVEGDERPLQAWDFVHCPPGTKHTIVGAGSGPCVIVSVGAPGALDHGRLGRVRARRGVGASRRERRRAVDRPRDGVRRRSASAQPARYDGWLPG